MRQYVQIVTEAKKKQRPSDIEIIPLNFEAKQVKPVMSKDTLDLHYDKLAKGYATRYNNKEGDAEFNYAGAFLHNVYFPQFRQVRPNNVPNGPIANFINKKFGSFVEFQKEFEVNFKELKDGNPQKDLTTFAESHCAFPIFAKVNKANKIIRFFIKD